MNFYQLVLHGGVVHASSARRESPRFPPPTRARSAGPSPTPKLIVEWNESTRHLRVIRCHSWPGFESTISQTISFVREEAKKKSILESIDWAFVDAVNEAAPARRTVIAGAMEEQNQKIRSSNKQVPTRSN